MKKEEENIKWIVCQFWPEMIALFSSFPSGSFSKPSLRYSVEETFWQELLCHSVTTKNWLFLFIKILIYTTAQYITGGTNG